MIVLGFLLMIGLGLACAGEVYKWVDKNGTVIFSETPPPAGTNTERLTLDKEGPIQIRVGMDKRQVLSIWGKPNTTSTYVSSVERTEWTSLWFYGHGRILRFINEILVEIEK
jgi:hypothetical protein